MPSVGTHSPVLVYSPHNRSSLAVCEAPFVDLVSAVRDLIFEEFTFGDFCHESVVTQTFENSAHIHKVFIIILSSRDDVIQGNLCSLNLLQYLGAAAAPNCCTVCLT